MRVLHVVKTDEGAAWVAFQVTELVKHGVDVHVALPESRARHPGWKGCGASLHTVQLDVPTREPWQVASRVRSAANLLDNLRPDIVHSHFVGTTWILRAALRLTGFRPPLVFQVPGPLHLEHPTYRALDVLTAGSHEYWIATSRCILRYYLRAGVNPARVFLSYSGTNAQRFRIERDENLRPRMGISRDAKVVGNIAWMYPPKYYLGQTRGLKGHEDVIDALGEVIRRRSDVVGLLAGAAWGRSTRYFDRLVRRARRAGGNRILMPGAIEPGSVAPLWKEFDCVVHLPRSENCGGVHEPLLAGVPVVAASVGGLPEVIVHGVTGRVVDPTSTVAVADAIEMMLDKPEEARAMAAAGRALTQEMFDVTRTAQEILAIYGHISKGSPGGVPMYDSAAAATRLRHRQEK